MGYRHVEGLSHIEAVQEHTLPAHHSQAELDQVFQYEPIETSLASVHAHSNKIVAESQATAWHLLT